MMKLLSGILVLGVILPLFAGCTSKQTETPPAPKQNPQQPQQPDGKPKPVVS
jgi:hypothetical protein